MNNLFARARDWLGPKLEESAGGTGTLSRGGQSTAGVPFVVGQVAFRSEADGGARVQVGDRDYLIAVAEYTIGGAAVKPELGDRFQEDGAAQVWEIQDVPTGEPAWRYSDPERTCYRIHVKRVA